MITAKAAREIAEKVVDMDIRYIVNKIDESIRDYSKVGRFECVFDLDGRQPNDEILKKLLSYLTENGYTIVHNKASDRDCSWNNLRICWQ